MNAEDITLAWFGVSTFRLTIGDTVVFLDAYLDRVSTAPDVGLRSADVDRCDFVLVGHSHFDHLWGAETIALATGAQIIGSYETVRVMKDAGVPREQLLPVAGGEPVRLTDDVMVDVYPSQHSCIWAKAGRHAGDECTGELGIALQDRGRGRVGMLGTGASMPTEIVEHLAASNQGARGDGGALAYVIATPFGTLYWGDTSGYYTGILEHLEVDVAILAAAGRGNVDGQPMQGSLAQFVANEADLLKPKRVAFCHHDAWMAPAVPALDVTPIADEIRRRHPHVDILDLAFGEEFAIFAGLR
jgi:L-ascorbate metabolism protein UlaG (beta-lactamase superfamily)